MAGIVVFDEGVNATTSTDSRDVAVTFVVAMPEQADGWRVLPAAEHVPHVSTVDIPLAALPRLVAILGGVPAVASAHLVLRPVGRLVAVGESVEQEVFALTPDAALALRGADGDPEMEWDDVAEQWKSHPDSAVLLAGRDVDELIGIIDELRSVAGELADPARLYCWEHAA